MEQSVKYYRNPDEPISLEDLKSFLWGAATRLRGQIDAAGYKEYIFPLLFFKRISDVYDEQFEGYVCEGGIEYANAQAQELVIRIPDGAHWRDVRECTENVGQRLVEAFIAIEQANPGEHADGRVIEAEKCTHKSGKQAYLFPEDINRIVEAYRSDEDIPGFSKHVSTEDILLNEGNLNIKSYVKSIDSHESLTLEDSLDKYIEHQNILSDTLSELCFVDSEMPKLSSPNLMYKESNNWARVRLSDVAEEYSVRIDNPSLSEYDFYIGSDCIGQYDFRIHKRSDASTITSAQKLFKEGDYLLVRRSLYGSDFRERAPRADFDGVCSADILTIREKKVLSLMVSLFMCSIKRAFGILLFQTPMAASLVASSGSS